jgi:hypothetical protein
MEIRFSPVVPTDLTTFTQLTSGSSSEFFLQSLPAYDFFCVLLPLVPYIVLMDTCQMIQTFWIFCLLHKNWKLHVSCCVLGLVWQPKQQPLIAICHQVNLWAVMFASVCHVVFSCTNSTQDDKFVAGESIGVWHSSSSIKKEGLMLMHLHIGHPVPTLFFVIQFYLQSILVHSANCVKTCIQWHVEECSVALLCN